MRFRANSFVHWEEETLRPWWPLASNFHHPAKNYLGLSQEPKTNSRTMASAASGRKSRPPGRGKNESRSLKRKRDVDDHEKLQKQIAELVRPKYPRQRKYLHSLGPKRRNKRILQPPFVPPDCLRSRGVTF